MGGDDKESAISFASTMEFVKKEQKRDELIDQLNRSLQALDVTPVSKSHVTKPRRIRSTLDKVSTNLKSIVRKVSTVKLPLTPKKKKPCKYCLLLVQKMSDKYKMTKLKTQQYMILTSTLECFGVRGLVRHFKVSKRKATTAVKLRISDGPFSHPEFVRKRKIDDAMIKLVENFYLDSNNSRASPNVRDRVYEIVDGKKVKVSIHRMLLNLKDLYSLFMHEHPDLEISISVFSKLRPRRCKWPRANGFHTVCCCDIHENFSLLLRAIDHSLDLSDYIKSILCSPPSAACYLSVCDKRPHDEVTKAIFDKVYKDEDDLLIDVWQWSRGTDGTDLKKESMDFKEFKQKLICAQFKLLEHEYVCKEQSKFLRHVKETILPNSDTILIQGDYSQNYTFVVQNAIYVSDCLNYVRMLHNVSNVMLFLFFPRFTTGVQNIVLFIHLR